MRNDGIHMPELSEPTLDELERLAEAIGERADGFELDMPDGSVALGDPRAFGATTPTR